MELTLNKLLKILFEKLWLIVIVTVIIGISAFSISSFLIKPKYESSATFQIYQPTETGSNDIAYVQRIKPNYIIYTTSDKFLQNIVNNLNANPEFVTEYSKLSSKQLDLEKLSKIITVSDYSKDNTFFNVTVQTLSPKTAFLICKEISDNGPVIYKQDESYSCDVTVIKLPKENLNPVSPNVPLNTIIGILLGIIVSILVVLAIETIDNSIKEEFDLIDNYEIPLLGVIYSHEIIENKTGA